MVSMVSSSWTVNCSFAVFAQVWCLMCREVQVKYICHRFLLTIQNSVVQLLHNNIDSGLYINYMLLFIIIQAASFHPIQIYYFSYCLFSVSLAMQ